jgi:hypothetical protein
MSEPQVYIHGSKLRRKAAADSGLKATLAAYESWKTSSLAVTGRTETDIAQLTAHLNEYKARVEPIFDKRNNSAQEVLQPSILEEFFEYLFCQIETEVGIDILRRPASGFIGLVFNPRDLKSLTTAPEYTIRQKDHDFVLGACITMDMSADGGKDVRREKLVVPAVAIECKRYLERNMLDECAGTAEKIKKATPYCRYIVVAEFLKMNNASPEISLIDEIYVLRRQRNLERQHADFEPAPIAADLVCHIYEDVVRHLKRIWWDADAALVSGRVFNYPR